MDLWWNKGSVCSLMGSGYMGHGSISQSLILKHWTHHAACQHTARQLGVLHCIPFINIFHTFISQSLLYITFTTLLCSIILDKVQNWAWSLGFFKCLTFCHEFLLNKLQMPHCHLSALLSIGVSSVPLTSHQYATIWLSAYKFPIDEWVCKCIWCPVMNWCPIPGVFLPAVFPG